MIRKITFSFLCISINFLLYAQPGTSSSEMEVYSYQSFQGYDETTAAYGLGKYQIFYDNIDGVFDKPFIIVDGFDPDDTNTISNIYNFLDYNAGANNLLDDLRDQGMDIVILNFPTYERTSDQVLIRGGADYIERNGLVLVNLLETLKQDLSANQEFIVMGVSMGGLISRYALTFMEQNTMDHQTALWFSFDAPQRGANVPIALQYLINFMAEYNDDDAMRTYRDTQLNSPAAKQMLLDHYSAHIQGGSAYDQDLSIQLPTPATTFRSTFEATMSSLGFPTQVRNLAIANGSINNTMVASPGVQVLNTVLDLGSGVNATIVLHFTPDINVSNYEIDYIRITWYSIELALYTTQAASPSYTAGLDSAPGGTVLFENYVDSSTDPQIQQIINDLEVDAFSFIPTLSSLAVDEQDWYQSVSSTTNTPFDAFIGPTVNEPHITLTTTNLAFILQEISDHYLDTQGYLQSDSYVLLNNPTKDQIRLKILNPNISEIEYAIHNISGQLLDQGSFHNPNGRIEFEAPKQSGLYFLRLKMDGYSFTEKVLIP